MQSILFVLCALSVVLTHQSQQFVDVGCNGEGEPSCQSLCETDDCYNCLSRLLHDHAHNITTSCKWCVEAKEYVCETTKCPFCTLDNTEVNGPLCVAAHATKDFDKSCYQYSVPCSGGVAACIVAVFLVIAIGITIWLWLGLRKATVRYMALNPEEINMFSNFFYKKRLVNIVCVVQFVVIVAIMVAILLIVRRNC